MMRMMGRMRKKMVSNLLTDIIIVGTAMFLVGTWLSSHHSHKIITNDHPEHKIREFLIYTCLGIALITVGSNMMTDGLISRLKGDA